jgi:hypothetical protein
MININPKPYKAVAELPKWFRGKQGIQDKQTRVTYWVPSKLNLCMVNDYKEHYWVQSGQGHNLPGTWDSRYQLALQMTRVLTASRINTNKHGIYKINITPNISTKCIIVSTRRNEIVGTRTTKFGATLIKLWFSEGLCD